MIEAYLSGDPYMAFAIQADLAPKGATKATHKDVRNRCKAIVLGVGYGMGPESMAERAGIHVSTARSLLRQHRETYRTFWKWAENNVNIALVGGDLQTTFGWTIRCGTGISANTRSLLNYPMQANGAEMLRLAICVATEAGLKICAPIHDALLIEAPLDRIDKDIATLKSIMIEASRSVLQTLECRVDVDVVRYPDRYMDEGGGKMWDRVMNLLEAAELREDV
jgi:DNA polymerase-1